MRKVRIGDCLLLLHAPMIGRAMVASSTRCLPAPHHHRHRRRRRRRHHHSLQHHPPTIAQLVYLCWVTAICPSPPRYPTLQHTQPATLSILSAHRTTIILTLALVLVLPLALILVLALACRSQPPHWSPTSHCTENMPALGPITWTCCNSNNGVTRHRSVLT